jgi:hypothetical protein
MVSLTSKTHFGSHLWGLESPATPLTPTALSSLLIGGVCTFAPWAHLSFLPMLSTASQLEAPAYWMSTPRLVWKFSCHWDRAGPFKRLLGHDWINAAIAGVGLLSLEWLCLNKCLSLCLSVCLSSYDVARRAYKIPTPQYWTSPLPENKLIFFISLADCGIVLCSRKWTKTSTLTGFCNSPLLVVLFT